MGRPKRIPDCHPDRPHCAKGLCELCYRNENDGNWRRGLKTYDKTLTDVQIEEWIARKKIGKCDICGGNNRLMFDHDHEQGKMRGILCIACNSLLGHSDDLPDRLLAAKNYLHKHLPKPKIVEIIWNDAQDSLDPWVGEDDAKAFAETPCPVRSIGFLVRKTKNYLVIAGDWNHSNRDYGRVTKIPTSMLVSIEDLECSKPSS